MGKAAQLQRTPARMRMLSEVADGKIERYWDADEGYLYRRGETGITETERRMINELLDARWVTAPTPPGFGFSAPLSITEQGNAVLRP
ncbi:hypothetical protein [Saccharopolyspora griseoalba]|uniref:Uncharacterized protein n=1 Tax=Saccharopolyspora griseoalba TaxID=1431848 RepID=A0ABW2LQL0_9PSEU